MNQIFYRYQNCVLTRTWGVETKINKDLHKFVAIFHSEVYSPFPYKCRHKYKYYMITILIWRKTVKYNKILA